MNKKAKKNKTEKYIEAYLDEIVRSIKTISSRKIQKIVDTLYDAYKGNNKIYVLGNGGSASISTHIACDLGKGTLTREYDDNENRLRVISLSENTALITAYANDLGYEEIFSQQLRNLIEFGDVLIAISGSGNSKNVINAVNYAKKVKAITIGLSGFRDGGQLAKIADISLVVKSNHYGPVEDCHMMLGHIFTSCISMLKHEEKLIKKRTNKSVPFSQK